MLTPEQARSLAEGLFDDQSDHDGVEKIGSLPERIGGHRILRRIASGGMGVVYEAEQAQPQRRVAIKVLRHGVASRSALRRFEHEAEVLAHLRHPGIAHVYDAGTHDDGAGGVPYFVMEYIEGAKSITNYADDADLSVRDRFELFAIVCDAVHHGHQKGVIHRDLKPANILVDECGQPKVIDFGIARATDADITLTTVETTVGQLVGTLQYMSPEQCDGDPHEIDTRSDVYSLGVVLYELLRGKPPYDIRGATITRAAQIIRAAEPEPLTQRSRALRGDVETIVLKALEKTRQGRYQSATDLGADIRRWLRGEVIDARPPSLWLRLGRFVVRHPVVTTSAACLLIALLTVVSTIATMQVMRHRPYSIERAADGREARLVSVAGRVLESWVVPKARGIVEATLVKQPHARGGRTLAILAFDPHSGTAHEGALRAFDANVNPQEPVWSVAVEDGDLPEQLRAAGQSGADFGARFIAVHDVFPGEPGDEIVVAFGSAGCSQVIRIVSLEGEILFQRWHQGNVVDACWLPRSELLVLAGLNCQQHWTDLGYPEVDSGRHPVVFFALQPALHDLENRWIDPRAPAPDREFTWYRWALPPQLAEQLTFAPSRVLGIRHPAPPSREYVEVTLSAATEHRRNFSVLLDETGSIVPGSIKLSNEYVILQSELPDPSGLHLGDLESFDRSGE